MLFTVSDPVTVPEPMEEGAAVERHEERKDTPNWDTKVRCTCGFESVSRAEFWKHAADELRSSYPALLAELTRQAAVVEALRNARAELSRWGWGDIHYHDGADVQEASVVNAIRVADNALAALDTP